MGSINFELFAGTIEVSVIIESASGGDFRNVMAVLDTGAAVSVIPTRLALELGYDLSKADQVEFVSATDVECRPLINVRSLTAIKETVSDIEVVCRDLPRSCLDSDEDSEAEALLGLNFLCHFNVNINFRTLNEGSIELYKRT